MTVVAATAVIAVVAATTTTSVEGRGTGCLINGIFKVGGSGGFSYTVLTGSSS